MTDERERRVDGAGDGASASGSTGGSPSDNTPNAGPGASSERAVNAPDPDGGPPVDFGDLSLPQRVFVAAVQNPTRGVVVVGLFAFAFSFYVAFWMVFPRVAAFASGVGLVLIGVMTAVYLLSR